MMNSQRPRLWCLSELYYPEQGTAAHLIAQIAEGLTTDFDVHVICGQPDYFASGVKAPARESYRATEIHRLRGTRFRRGGLLAKIINALTFALVVFCFALWRFRKDDRILAATNPPPLPIVIGIAARLRRCDATMIVHDVYPEVLITAES